jgi:hypothetical protein
MAFGQAGAETAHDVAEKSQAAHFQYHTMKVSGKMKLLQQGAVIGEREIAAELIENPDQTAYDHARITIVAPNSLKGLRLLSWSSDKKDNQQWLFTPRTSNTQRISKRGQSGVFVGSDFSYEDILKWQIDRYDYKLVGQGAWTCPEGQCFIVEAKPNDPYSNYKYLVVHYDPLFRIKKIEYFDDRRQTPWKTLIQEGYQKYGKSWQPGRSVITDHITKTSTEIGWYDYVVDEPIDEKIMSPQSIDR